MNIADLIEGHARTRPGAPAVLKGDWQMSHGALAGGARRVAAILGGQGVAASDAVGVSIRGNVVLLLLTIIALARLGAVLLPIHPASLRIRRKPLTEHYRLAAIVAGQDDPGSGVRTIVADASWLQERMPEGTPPPSHPGGEHPWAILLTSGTTGTPKGVLRTHASFLKVAALQRPLWHFGPDSRLFSFMDLHNGAALKRTLAVLSHGGAISLMDAKSAGGPPIDRHGVTHVFASPLMMQEWTKGRSPGLPPFGTLESVCVGGSAMPPALARDIVERITPNLFLSYGATEADVIAASDPQLRARDPALTGRLVPWVEAEAVDQNDRPLPAGASGILRYRGEGVASGYHGVAPEPGAHAKAFRDGWFYPGDVGRITAERLVYVEGRVDDIVNLGGAKINAAAVEAVLARHPGVREVAVFTVVTPAGQTLLVAAVAARGALDQALLARSYQDQGGKFSDLLRFVQVAKLPRNASGKVLKQELERKIGIKLAKQA